MRLRGWIVTAATAVAVTMALSAAASIPIRVDSVSCQAPDSADVAYYHGSKRYLTTAAEVVGFNTGLWAIDRWVCNSDFARISFKTIAANFREGFKWDNDQLGTNMFLHPYTGNLYYNAARSNGFNFWQSGLWALGGSALWEMCMENEYPSINDIISTPIGGMCIGEVTYRASDAIIDDRSTGAERVAREVGVFLVSPMRGLNRVLRGDAWRHRATSGRVFGTPAVRMEISTGVSVLDYRHDNSRTRVGGTLRVNLEYGNRYEVKSTKPYDYFIADVSLNMMKTQPMLQHFGVIGRLLARELAEDRDQHVSIGLFQHFDYYDTDTIKGGEIPYKLGVPASVGAGVYYRDIERGRCVFDAYGHVNAVILGAIMSDHYRLGERNYNLAAGMSTKVGINFVFDRGRWGFSANNSLYLLWTWKGYSPFTDFATVDTRTLNVMGDRSRALFSVTSVRADLRLTRRLYLTLSLEHYLRVTHYRYAPRVSSTSLGAELMLTYKL